MKKIPFMVSLTLFLATVATVAAVAQSNGSFSITQSVISNGGGTSVNGAIEVTGTIAQPVTATSAGALIEASSGFWQRNATPTAAGVSLAGRVLTNDGRGLNGATVIVIDHTGTVRTSRTSSFGYYRIDGLVAGQSLTVSVASRKFRFQPRIIELTDSLDDFDLTAITPESP